ncbi:MAG TPA: TlpA disulfide reductase family protein [Candidatus Thermoplasmatota archaeon]|jgi:thiol-disulfide isomerase/thioredoxin|nr:TlpA disulfide reductase family protein [Candidatus Thermoplasmatota archaeon]
MTLGPTVRVPWQALALLGLLLAGCTAPDARTVGPLVGNLAPPFEVQPVDAPAWNLSAMQGKAVVLDLMGVNCGPCRVEMPHLLELAARRANDTAFGLVSIDMASVFPSLGARNDSEIRGFKAEFNATWPFAPDTGGWVGRAYEPIALPTAVVVGPDGVIRAKHSGGTVTADQFEADLAAAREAAS